MKPIAHILVTAAMLAVATRAAHADTSHCTAITALPATLSNEGVYCLTQDLSYVGTTGAAVTIAANSVTIDLNGHAIRSNSAANVQSVGINVVGRKYFTIVDGTIAGFSRGVAVVSDGSTPSVGGVIADLKVQRTFLYGLMIVCNGCVVRDNLVTDTVLPSNFVGDAAAGIAVEGSADQVIGNRVYDTWSVPSQGQQAWAISVGAANAVVARNYAVNTPTDATTIGGFIISGVGALVDDNQATAFATCYWLQGVNLKYRNNLGNSCAVGYGGGASGGAADLGGNH